MELMGYLESTVLELLNAMPIFFQILAKTTEKTLNTSQYRNLHRETV